LYNFIDVIRVSNEISDTSPRCDSPLYWLIHDIDSPIEKEGVDQAQKLYKNTQFTLGFGQPLLRFGIILLYLATTDLHRVELVKLFYLNEYSFFHAT
jgi:hypothetical protein